MGLFGTLFGLGVDIVKLPISAVVDVVTVGGIATDSPSSVMQNLDEIKDDLDDLTD